MPIYYGKKAFETLKEEGPIELLKKSKEFILRRVDPEFHYRFRIHTLKNDLFNRIQYDSPPNPYKTIEIRPSKINDRAGVIRNDRELKKIKRKGIARTRSGDWDRHKVNVENVLIIKGIKKRFEQDEQWEDTEYYDHLCKSFEKNKQKYNQKGFDDLNQYLQQNFERADDLFDKIKAEGYKPNHTGQQVRPGHDQPVRSRLEVLVTIDRDGNINFFEGNHRFAIARVLDIAIPAHVVCRHKKWQEIRDDIYNNGVSEKYEELLDHPDLQDVIDD